ncbi:MAG: ABC transporter permease [Ardenticatenaceae bacterium]
MKLASVFTAELRRGLRRMWAYRYDTLGEMALWLVAFPVMLAIFSDVSGSYGPEQRLASLIGFLVWDLSMGVLTGMAQEVVRESREGTLESIMLSPWHPRTVFSVRFAAAFVVQGLRTLVLGLVLLAVLRLPLSFTGSAPILLLLTILGVAGVGLALAGLTLVHKNLESVVGIAALLAVLFTGALVPLNALGPVYEILKYLIPTTWGIDSLREVIINGASLTSLMADGTILGLSLQAAAFLGLGVVVFGRSFRQAQLQGSLGSY